MNGRRSCRFPKGAGVNLIYALPSIVERIGLPKLFPRRNRWRWSWAAGMGRSWRNMPGCTRSRTSSGWNGCRSHAEAGPQGPAGGADQLARRAHRVRLFPRIPAAAGLGGALHIYFPDPWPKRKHRRHRLVSERFPALAQQVLAPGGTVYLRTDDEDYFEQMERSSRAPGLSAVETPGELAGLLTDFEKEFQARGIQTLRAAYRLA